MGMFFPAWMIVQRLAQRLAQRYWPQIGKFFTGSISVNALN
jgi:hypothetical protein